MNKDVLKECLDSHYKTMPEWVLKLEYQLKPDFWNIREMKRRNLIEPILKLVEKLQED